MKCRICGSDQIALEVVGREMMIPTREQFAYFECDNCHCLQIKEVPKKLGDYYGENYYSYQNTSDTEHKSVTNMTPVLDVGCGAGDFLKQLREIGYGNLIGCDPFLPQDISYGDEIHIYRKTIHEMEGCFEQIFLNDSFEHVTDPHEVMESISRLLSPQGMVRINIPVYPNIAFDMFEADWFQLDAPRHIFLHSRESMELLAREHGLKIVKVEYNADPAQIYRSFLYSQDIPFWEQKMATVLELLGREEVDEIEKLSKESNENGCGDHAAFYLVHATKEN